MIQSIGQHNTAQALTSLGSTVAPKSLSFNPVLPQGQTGANLLELEVGAAITNSSSLQRLMDQFVLQLGNLTNPLERMRAERILDALFGKPLSVSSAQTSGKLSELLSEDLRRQLQQNLALQQTSQSKIAAAAQPSLLERLQFGLLARIYDRGNYHSGNEILNTADASAKNVARTDTAPINLLGNTNNAAPDRGNLMTRNEHTRYSDARTKPIPYESDKRRTKETRRNKSNSEPRTLYEAFRNAVRNFFRRLVGQQA